MSIAHTRWATHGPPSERNCHPLKSDPTAEFCVVHNGIVTNSAELRLVLQKRGFKFESDTDTEAVAILTKYIYDTHPDKNITFTNLVKSVLKELEGSFAFVFKSKHFPNEVVTARRGSPLLIGVKTDKKLKVDFVDVEFAGQDKHDTHADSRESTHFLDVIIRNNLSRCSSTQFPGKFACTPQYKSQGSANTIACIHVRGWTPPAY